MKKKLFFLLLMSTHFLHAQEIDDVRKLDDEAKSKSATQGKIGLEQRRRQQGNHCPTHGPIAFSSG